MSNGCPIINAEGWCVGAKYVRDNPLKTRNCTIMSTGRNLFLIFICSLAHSWLGGHWSRWIVGIYPALLNTEFSGRGAFYWLHHLDSSSTVICTDPSWPSCSTRFGETSSIYLHLGLHRVPLPQLIWRIRDLFPRWIRQYPAVLCYHLRRFTYERFYLCSAATWTGLLFTVCLAKPRSNNKCVPFRSVSQLSALEYAPWIVCCYVVIK